MFHSSSFAQTNQATYLLDGQVSLMSDYVADGVSQSNHDPALQGSFWFNMGPQFRMGLWGSSVSYDRSTSHFLLKANADLRVDFATTTSLNIGYSMNRYFKSDDRDGSTFSLIFNLFSYGIHYARHSNFLGTEDPASGYAFSKTWLIYSDWNWKNLFGYMTVEADSLSNYFYYETYLGKKFGTAEYEIGGMYNSSAGQFNGAASPTLMARASVSF